AAPSGRQDNHVPSLDEIRDRALQVLGRRPCLWQCRVAQAQLRGDKDVVCISGTGSGKTLTFWIPLLFRPQGIQIVITPLNLLGSQNTGELQWLGINAIALCGKTATPKNFEDIELFKYRVIAVNPEVTFKVGGGFQKLWRNPTFTSRLISVIWDEAHCIRTWAGFRSDYGEAGRLRNMIPTRFLLPSATLPGPVLHGVLNTLQVPPVKTVTFRRSNDRPNVFLTVHKMQYAISSFKDLDFLIPDNWSPEVQIRPFVVFFDSIEDSVKAAERMQQRLPPEHRKRIMWINSDTTAALRELATEEFARGDLLGLYCTDSFGMGIDVATIQIIVQWRPTCDIDTLWQRFGRAARGAGTEGLAILIVDGKHFDEAKAAAQARDKKKKDTAEKKATEREQGKRKRAESASTAVAVSRRRVGSHADQTVAPSLPVEVVPMSKYEELRVQFQLSAPRVIPSGKKSVKGGGKTEVIGPELDNIINAGTRPFQCYRVPITAFYENDRTAQDGEDCLPNTVGGCARCRLSPSPICCSLCTPDHAAFAILPPSPPPQPSVPRASTVPNKYTMSITDHDLHDTLDQFRRARTQEEFGVAILNNLGPGLVMGNAILERIVDCARVHKLGTLESLYRETKWDLTWELGERVLDLVKNYYPPPAPAPLPLNVLGNTDANVGGVSGSNSRGVCKKICSACHQLGHIRSNRICPEYGKHTPRGKENRSREGTDVAAGDSEDQRVRGAAPATSTAATHSHISTTAAASASVSGAGPS
ncbi:P-loop containing nucleoside triphosphate hydrolase protein, partial [Ganoderma leucocontextum]